VWWLTPTPIRLLMLVVLNMVVGSNTTLGDPGNNLAGITLSLWYNTCNQQNFARMDIYSGSALSTVFLAVIRQTGPDGGKLVAANNNCPKSGVCNSPGVYSPNNKSQAWLQDPYVILLTDNF